MQKILSLIITAAILYYIVQMKMQPLPENNNQQITSNDGNNQNSISFPESSNTSLTGNFFEKTLSKVVINALKTEEGRVFFENILQPLQSMNTPITDDKYKIEVNRDLIQPMFKINSFGQGIIGPASCGHVVTIHYQLLDINNKLLSDNTKTFTLGSRTIMAGIDNVIIGMMVGQKRQALIPAKYAYYNQKYRKDIIDPDAAYRVNIVLQAILPQNFIKDDEVKVFDDEIAYRTPLLCGDRAMFDAKITRLSNGKVLYNSIDKNKKLDMKIGDIYYPLIFSYALHGKIPVGTRTVIAKGRSFKALGSNLNKIIAQDSLSIDEYLMLELTNFQIN